MHGTNGSVNSIANTRIQFKNKSARKAGIQADFKCLITYRQRRSESKNNEILAKRQEKLNTDWQQFVRNWLHWKCIFRRIL